MSHLMLRRWTRWLLVGLAGLLGLVTVLVAMLQISPVATWLVRRLVTFVPLNPGYTIVVGRAGGTWLTRVQLEGVRLRREGRDLLHIDRLLVAYDPHQLLGADTRLRTVLIDGVRASARRTPAGWDLTDALRTSPDTTDTTAGRPIAIERFLLRNAQLAVVLGPDSTFEVHDLAIHARKLLFGTIAIGAVDTARAELVLPGRPVRRLTLAGRGAATPEAFRVDTLRIAGGRSVLAGTAVVPRRWDEARLIDQLAVRFDAAPLALADVATWAPSVRVEGEVWLTLRATAEGRHAVGRVTGRVGEARLLLNGSAVVGTGTLTDLQMQGTVRALDPARLLAAASAGRLNADLDVGLHGPDLRRTNGHIELTVNDSRLGGIRLPHLGLRTELADGRAQVALRGTVDRGTIAARGWVRPFDSIPSYELSGEARRLPGTDSLAQRLAGPAGDPALVVGAAVNGRGTAVATAQLTGQVEVAALRRDGERVRLITAPLTLTNGRLDMRPVAFVAGGRITGLATAWFGDTIRYAVRQGTIERVDLGHIAGDTVSAPVSGRFTLSGRGTAPAEAVVAARLDIDQLRYGRRRVDKLSATARLDHGQAALRAVGAVQGGRLALELAARPFDSTRTLAIRRASLERVDVGALLDRPALAGPITLHLSGRGRWAGERRAFQGRVAIEPSRLGRIDVHAGTLAAALNDDRATYEASIRTNGGAVAFAGDATGLGTAPAFSIRGGRFDSLDLAILLGRPALESRLDGRFAGALAGRGLDSLRGALAIDLEASRAADVTIHGGRLALDIDRGAIRGEVRVTSSDGHLLVQTALQTTSDTAGLLSLGGTVTSTGAFHDIQLDTLLVALQPVPGAVVVDTVLVRSNVAVLDGSGGLALRPSAGSDTLRLVGHARNFAPVSALAGPGMTAVDSAHLRVVVTGPARDWRVAAEAEAWRLLYAGNQAERLAVLANVAVDSSGVAGLAGRLHVEGGAVGRVHITDLTAAARYDSLIALQAAVMLDDSVRLATTLHGTVAGDTVRATLERLDFTEQGRTWSLERPTALVLRPRLEIDGLALRSGDRYLTATGTLDRQGQSDFAMQMVGVDLGVLRGLGLSPIPGRLDGTLRLTGPAATPTLAGRFALAVPLGNEEAGRIAAELTWTARGLRLDAAVEPRRSGRLTATGTLPWRLTFVPRDTGAVTDVGPAAVDTLGFAVRADSFDLAFFDPLLPPENAKNLRGALALDVRVAGTLKQPRVAGTVRLTGAGVELPPLGLTYEEGELAGELAGSELRVSRLRLRTDDDEELTGQGVVRFQPLDNPMLALTATLRDFRIANSPTLHAVASGRLELRGTAAEPSLTGGLRLGRTEIFQGGEATTAAVKPVELTAEDMRMLAQHFGPAVLAHAEQGPGLVERFHLDIDLRLPQNVWFRRRVNPKADIELAGQIKLRQKPGQEMQFFGRVEPTPKRGGLDIYGRTFRLTGGEILLNGPVDSMTLDVTAEYQVPTQSGPESGILIDVAAKGRADSLSLDFTSEPSMGQEDIISYIITGRPASENPLAQEGGSAGEAGAGLAFGALSERVAAAAGEKLGLDVFQIKQDGLRGLTLTAGRYVAPRVFLSLQQPIQLSSSAAQERPGANMGPGFEVEYAARRWLRANVRGGSLPPRLFVRGRYVY